MILSTDIRSRLPRASNRGSQLPFTRRHRLPATLFTYAHTESRNLYTYRTRPAVIKACKTCFDRDCLVSRNPAVALSAGNRNPGSLCLSAPEETGGAGICSGLRDRDSRDSIYRSEIAMLAFLVCLLPIVASGGLIDPIVQNNIPEIDNGTLKSVEFIHDFDVTELNLSSHELHAIEKNALDNATNVESLNLSYNSLTSLPEFIFSNLTKLRNLWLSNNQISSLRNLFVGLENLQLLDISHNPIRHLTRGNLFGLTKSTRILTDGNIFWSISTDVFTNSFLKNEDLAQIAAQTIDETEEESEEIDNTEVQEKKVSRTLDKNIRMKLCKSDGIVSSLDILQEDEKLAEGCIQVLVDEEKQMNLRDQGITDFQEGWYRLQSLPIASLDLSNNKIAEIKKETLNNLPEDLTYVNFQGNKIRKIRREVIQNDHLRELNFKSNLIEEIEEDAFAKTKLRGLYLAENQLKSLNFVSTLPDTLTTFIASGNRITSIPDDAFSKLSHLLHLNLDENKIETLQNNIFQNLKSLRTLNLVSNNITTVEQAAFKGLTALKTLELQRNSIHNLQRGTFAELTALKMLILSRNKITNATLIDLPRNVNYLHLDFNEIDELEKDSFVEAPRILLSLTGNKISRIAHGAFNLPTLKDLYLNNNTLATIDGDSYEGLGHLKRLWLSGNQISEIRKGSCKNLGSLYILNISQNPFQKLEAGALYGLSTAPGSSLYIYDNDLKEMQVGLFDDV